MTKRSDMMGVGFSSAQANALGLSTTAITAAGTTTSDATVCNNYDNVFNMTATGADGIRLNSSTPLLTPVYVANTSGSNGKVYPSTGGAFNGGSTDAAITVGANKSLYAIRISTNVWMSNLSA